MLARARRHLNTRTKWRIAVLNVHDGTRDKTLSEALDEAKITYLSVRIVVISA